MKKFIYWYWDNMLNQDQIKQINLICKKHNDPSIEDAVDGIIKAIQCRLKKYNVINISSGKRYRSTEIIKLAQELSHKKLKFKLKKTAPEEKCVWANNFKAKKLLKFAPKISIKHGLNLTLKRFSL